ncbi:hypothetical protein D9611_013831 [Ephemerocybe angulata]|uniref:NodB homology domain-containing protein n=1 Tax=Ephemerocybe angulata TaxID=980116 RepID=A0A8H5C3W5_9AGAR|nr:hypothetical protein D9611_013831 [Tulosesus angulatus]
MLVMKNLLPLLSIVGFLSTVFATPLEKRAKAQVFRSCTVPNTVALTFDVKDDGPYIYMNDLINTLNKENTATTVRTPTSPLSFPKTNGPSYALSLFLFRDLGACIYNDDNIRNIKRAYDSGHQLGSHTWSHKDLTTLSWDQMHDEMWRVEQAILRITGALPAFVRPPYGNYNDLVLEAAGARGLTISNWDFDSEDGKAASIDRQKGLYDAAVKAHPSTILSLEHEVHATSVYEVLPYAIAKLRAAGYRFVTVAECLNMKPYQLVLPPSTKDASWKC